MSPYHSILAVACMMCAAAFGLTNVYWAGGESGDWSDPNNWSPKQAPVSENYCAILTPRTAPATITVTEDLTVGQVLFGVTGEAQTSEDYFPMITLKGPGTLKTTTGSYVYEKRRCEFTDGLEFSPPNIWTSYSNYVVRVKNGATLNSEYAPQGSNGILILEDGGVLNAERFSAGEDYTLCIKGGELNVSVILTLNSKTKFTWDGGKITVKYPVSDPRLVPDRADEILNMVSAQNYVSMPVGAGKSYELNGFIYTTNSVPGSNGAVEFAGGGSYWHGTGGFHACRILFPYGITRTEFDISTICIGSSFYPRASSTDCRCDIYGGVEFGSFGNWNFGGSQVGSVYLRGPIKVNTLDCYDGETKRTVDMSNLYPRPTSTLELTGGGVVTGCVRNAACQFDAVTVTNGTKLVVKRLTKQPFLTQKLNVCAGSTLELTAGTAPIETFETPSIDPTATVLVNLPASPVSGNRYPILSTSSTNDVDISRFVLTAADPGAWRIAQTFGRVYLTDDVVVEPAFDYEWTGAVNGNWSEPGNWKNGIVPNASDARVAFRSSNQVAVTNDIDGLKVYNIRFDNGGPFTLLGKEIALASSGLNTATNDAIYVCGGAPATIACPIKGASDSNWMSFKIDYDSCLTLLGNITKAGWSGFSFRGDARFRGTVSTSVTYTYGSSDNARATIATILPGSKLTCSSQSQNNLGGSLRIVKDAESVYKGGKFCSNGSRTHFVDGLLDIHAAVPYSGSGNQYFEGAGLVCIAKPVSYSSADSTTYLGTGITLRPGARWNTVTSDAADKFVRLGVDSFGTISITNDFSYGPQPGLETTTTAADRALQLPRPACTLTVDTQDPVSGEGHTATFEDPIIGYGKLVKRGAGTLVFASAENAITGGVEIAEGAFTWAAPQTLQKLSFGASAKVVFPASAPSLTVEKGLDLTGAVIDLSAIPPMSLAGWTEVIGTADGGVIAGVPEFSVPGRFRSRVVRNGAGGESLEVRCILGTQFMIR